MDGIYTSSAHIAVAPGITIREIMESRGMTGKELAFRCGVTEKHISHLLTGKAELTPGMAHKIAISLDTEDEPLLKLEASYRLNLIKVQEDDDFELDAEIAKRMPYVEMAKRGWIKKVVKIRDKINELRNFFQLTKLSLISNPDFTSYAFRQLAQKIEADDYSMLCWLQRVRRKSEKICTDAVNLSGLPGAIPAIKDGLTAEVPNFKLLQDLLCKFGIALVFVKYLPKSRLCGASFLNNGRIVIGISGFGNELNRFWYDLFHEIGHVVSGHVLARRGKSENDQEHEADNFAFDNLLGNSDFASFVKIHDFSRRSITDLAKRKKVLPGMIVWKLQVTKHIPFSSFNDLKTPFDLGKFPECV